MKHELAAPETSKASLAAAARKRIRSGYAAVLLPCLTSANVDVTVVCFYYTLIEFFGTVAAGGTFSGSSGPQPLPQSPVQEQRQQLQFPRFLSAAHCAFGGELDGDSLASSLGSIM